MANNQLGIGNIDNWQHYHIGNIPPLPTSATWSMKAICALHTNRSLCYNTSALKSRSKLNGFKIEVVNVGTKKIYVQSAFTIPDEAKRRQEIASFMRSGDFFRKIVVVSGFKLPQQDENGIVYVGVIPFLLDPAILAG